MVTQTSIEGHHIEDDNTDGDDDALTNLETVDTRQDIDGVSAEDRQEAHVDVVEDAQLEAVAEYPSQKSWNHNFCPEVDIEEDDIDDDLLVPVSSDVVNHQ